MGRSDRHAEKGRRSPCSPDSVATPSRGGARGPPNALEELLRRRGVDEAWSALEEMLRQGRPADKYTVSRMLMKTVGDGHARFESQRVYRGISIVERFIELQPKDVDEVLFNALLDTCCRLKDLNRLETIARKMRELKVIPSPVTLGILVKAHGQVGDLRKVLQVWDEMERQRGLANAVTYGCMLDACVKCGHIEKAVEVFEGLRPSGKHRNTILYTTLIKGYGLEKDALNAIRLFREMPMEGVPYNTITYNSILDACVRSGELEQAEGLFREMIVPGAPLEPDLITFSTILKGYCHVGDLDKALQVVETIKARGLRCDELVYNTLMDGCVKVGDVAAGVGLFSEMVHNGMRPSAITNSILARLYQRAGHGGDAGEAVAQLYRQHGVERPGGGLDRGKAPGRRGCPPRGGGARGGRQSPHGSPGSASGHVNGFGGRWRDERSDAGCSDSGWSNWGGAPERSVPSTPCDGNATGQFGLGCYISLEALRAVPPLPGSAGGADTPYSGTYSASCTPGGSMAHASFLGSYAGSCAGSPSAASYAGSVAGSPNACTAMTAVPPSPRPQAPPPSLPPWPFAGAPCTAAVGGPGGPGAAAAAVPPPPAGAPGVEPGQVQQYQQVIAIPMMHTTMGPASNCAGMGGQKQAYFESLQQFGP